MAADMCLYDVAYCIVDRAATPFSGLFQIRTVLLGSRTVMRLLLLGGGSPINSGSSFSSCAFKSRFAIHDTLALP